jgi:glycyl-tRNA synthetase
MEKLMEKEKNEDKKKEYAAVVARIDDFSPLELEETMAKYRVLSPEGKPVSAPFPFNLMFAISIGPTGMYKGYVRYALAHKGLARVALPGQAFSLT